MENLTPLFEFLVDQIGPIGAILFLVCCFLGWLVWVDRKGRKDAVLVPHEFQELLEKHRTEMDAKHVEMVRVNERYHEAMVDSTRALERLAILLEERTRRQSKLG